MLKETRQLISTSATYSVGNIMVKFITFLLIPLYARKLLPDEYGVVAILELVELLGKTIFSYGLVQSVLRFLVSYKTQGRANELVFSNYLFLVVVNIIVLGALVLFPTGLSRVLLDNSADSIRYIQLILIVIFFGVIQTLFITLLQAEEKAVPFIIFTVLTFLLTIGLNIYKVGFLNQGVRGIVESKLYVAMLNFVLISGYLLKRFRPRFSFAVIRESIDYGLPLIFVGVSLTMLSLADRYLLKVLRDVSEVGIYAMAYKFGMIINMVLITPFRQAFFPLMFRLAEEQDIKGAYRKFLTYFVFVGLLFVLFVSSFAKEILILATTPKYYHGYIIIPFIAFSYFLFGVRTIFANALATQKRTRAIAYSTVFGAVFHICFNLILIPYFGMIGAAIVSVTSYSVITIATFVPLQKIFPISWDWGRIFRLLFVALILLLVSLSIRSNYIWLNILLKFLILISYPLILYFTNFFTPTEIKSIGKTYSTFRQKLIRN